MALITAESNFNPKAISPKNAQGLMQLIPATAVRFGVKNAYNPVENLKGGLAYLQWLMAYFKGDVALVLAAYNAGEMAVEKYRGIPPYGKLAITSDRSPGCIKTRPTRTLWRSPHRRRCSCR